MRIVFMGSAQLACDSLEMLLERERVELVGVVAQPARPRGRRLRSEPCATVLAAAGSGVALLTPENVNAPDTLAQLRVLKPDLIAVLAYGQILRREVLDLPPQGCVNIHTSLLPRYRGAAPIQWAIARGERVTGVTAIFMNERMDAGDTIAQREVPIGPQDTAVDLHERLGREGAALLSAVIESLLAGTTTRRPQDEAAVTFAPKLKKEDGRIDWTLSAEDLYNRVRGLNPWPGCFCSVPAPDGPKSLKILRARVARGGGGEPGDVLDVGPDGPLVAAGDGALRLLELQLEGRRAMSGGEYVRGHPLERGQRWK